MTRLLAAVLFAGCATAPPAPVPEPAPLAGERLAFEAGAPEVEYLALPPPPGRIDLGQPLAAPSGMVARDERELERTSVKPAEPIDFTRWVAIVPSDTLAAGQRARVIVATAETVEVRLGRRSAERVEAVYVAACSICGGASSVQAEIQRCREGLVPRVYLVPRPSQRLVLGLADTRCDPRLP